MVFSTWHHLSKLLESDSKPHILGSNVIIELATKYRNSEAQIFLAYLMSQGITPLSGTTSMEHMHDDLEVEQITLEPEEIDTINALLYH